MVNTQLILINTEISRFNYVEGKWVPFGVTQEIFSGGWERFRGQVLSKTFNSNAFTYLSTESTEDTLVVSSNNTAHRYTYTHRPIADVTWSEEEGFKVLS